MKRAVNRPAERWVCDAGSDSVAVLDIQLRGGTGDDTIRATGPSVDINGHQHWVEDTSGRALQARELLASSLFNRIIPSCKVFNRSQHMTKLTCTVNCSQTTMC